MSACGFIALLSADSYARSKSSPQTINASAGNFNRSSSDPQRAQNAWRGEDEVALFSLEFSAMLCASTCVWGVLKYRAHRISVPGVR